jgi:hypothetical protein
MEVTNVLWPVAKRRSFGWIAASIVPPDIDRERVRQSA